MLTLHVTQVLTYSITHKIAHITPGQTLGQRGIAMNDEQKVKLVTNLLTVTVSDHDTTPTLSVS